MSNQSNTIIDLDNFWPYQAVFLADQISRFTLATAKAEAGLNLSQWRVLAAIAQTPGCTAAEVVTITPMDKTIVSRAVSSLIDCKLIIKTAEKDDKRKSSLTATEQGLASYERIATLLNTALIDNFSGDTPPDEFVSLLKEFIKKMDTAL